MNARTTILPSILPFWQDMELSVDIFPDIVSGERRSTVLGNPDSLPTLLSGPAIHFHLDANRRCPH